MLMSGEIPYRTGQSFLYLREDEATTILNDEIDTTQSELRQLQDEIVSMKSEIDTYKAALYAKFGRDQINLDEY